MGFFFLTTLYQNVLHISKCFTKFGVSKKIYNMELWHWITIALIITAAAIFTYAVRKDSKESRDRLKQTFKNQKDGHTLF